MTKISKNKIIVLLFSLIIILCAIFHISIPCPIYSTTGLHCPGCGVTRMLREIFKLNFYQAFRYNMLLFILMPFFMFYIINNIYCIITHKENKALYKKIPINLIYILIIILLLFGILRNIFPILAPTKL